MQDTYVFPAYFCYEDDSDQIGIVFPDLPGCTSQADNDAEAMRMAKEAMTLHLWGMEEDDDKIPQPTPVKDLRPEADQAIVLVEAFMPPFRERMNNKAVTKTVTVPRWLELEAKSASLNYSQILQDGIMSRLGIKREIPRRRARNKASV